MIKPIFKINGQLINQPNNWQELGIELNFDKDDPDYSGEVTTSKWELGLGSNRGVDGANVALAHVDGGLTGGVGALEGAGFEITLQTDTGQVKVFDGYLDLSEAEFTCDKITAKAVERGSIDWLNEVADSFTISSLTETEGSGRITDLDIVQIPYILNSIPNTQEIFTLTISVFVVTQELIDTFQEWQEWSVAFSSDWLEFGNLVTLIVLTIKNVLLIIALVKLVSQIIDATIQPLKFKSAMFLNTIAKRGAQRLGYNDFKSTILDSVDWRKVALIPENRVQFENSIPGSINLKDKLKESLVGVFQPRQQDGSGTYNGTYGEYLRELKKMFNGKLIVEGNILRLERRDYTTSSALFTLPQRDMRDMPFRFNVEDFKSNFLFRFSTDENDNNTEQNYPGTALRVFTVAKVITDKKRLLAKGLSENISNWTLGVRKNKLTYVEKFIAEFLNDLGIVLGLAERFINDTIRPANKLLRPVKKIIKAINTLPNVTLKGDKIKLLQPVKFNFNIPNRANITRRIGVLSMENDIVKRPKLVMLDTSDPTTDPFKIKVNTRMDNILNAESIYDNYYAIDSFVGANNNQGKIYTITDVPFCIEDYFKVRENNIIFESDGITKAEVKSLKWNIYKQTAEITYKTNETWTDNLKQIKDLDNGR